MLNEPVPNCTFHTRVKNGDTFEWKDVTTEELFKGKRVVLFSLPGAFTPTCSTYQLPDFEDLHDVFVAKGIDEVYCMSVNDSFVMNAWAKDQGLQHVKVIPDGSGLFTLKMECWYPRITLGLVNVLGDMLPL